MKKIKLTDLLRVINPDDVVSVKRVGHDSIYSGCAGSFLFSSFSNSFSNYCVYTVYVINDTMFILVEDES